MVKRSLIVCCALLGLHALCVALFPNAGRATNQRQDNLIKTETVLLNNNRIVTVGTSLSSRIIADSIQQMSFFTLSGNGVETPLQMLDENNIYPEYLFIESNYILKDGAAEIQKPSLLLLKRYIPSLRERYSPISLIADGAMSTFKINAQEGAVNIDYDFLNRSTNYFIQTDTVPNNQILENKIAGLKALTDRFVSHGTKVIFFEMPVNVRLSDTELYHRTRAVLRERFESNGYGFMASDTARYITTDGKHLDYHGQLQYTRYFKAQIEKMIK